MKKRVIKFFKKAVPLWVVLMLVLDSSLLLGIGEYYLMDKRLKDASYKLSAQTQNPDQLIQMIKQQVLPVSGYKTSLQWKNIGKQLVLAGVIDRQKFDENFKDDLNAKDYMKYLDFESDDKMEINERNSHFMVNVLWGLGLVNKSKVLDEGPMKSDSQVDTSRFASTAGWTLGKDEAMSYYSSKELIPLTDEQQELIKKIAQNVYRPCCGNSTAFPDCNHGMAALGYIELAVKNGLSEDQIYKDLLAFNSFWFPQNYVEMGVYFNKTGTSWDKVDPKNTLAANFSSAQGTQRIKQAIQNVPGINQGGGCGA